MSDYTHPTILAANLLDHQNVIRRLKAEIADLRTSVVAFGAPWAVEYAAKHELPPGQLHHVHYDILAAAGGRMDDFTRSPSDAEPGCPKTARPRSTSAGDVQLAQ
jgi:hypothetical protein